jgi:hypothetical protein
VTEATRYCDTALAWSVWTTLESFASPAWVGARGFGGAENTSAWTESLATQARSSILHWFPHDRVGAARAVSY